MSTFASKARAIASYFASRRQRGHSTVQREGYARHPRATLVVPNHRDIGAGGLQSCAVALSNSHFEAVLGAFDTPLVIEHAALQVLLDGLLGELDQMELGSESWKQTAAQHLSNEEYYAGLIDKALAEEPAAYESDDGSKWTEPLRAKLPEIVARYRADIAHRDRALRHLAEFLGNFTGCPGWDHVEGAMRETAKEVPAKPKQPLQVTVNAEVAPLLKALDELSCALRGIRRDEPKAEVSA